MKTCPAVPTARVLSALLRGHVLRGAGGRSRHAEPRVRLPADLKKYRRYEVIVTAYNIIGESPASAPVEVFVGEAGKPEAWPRAQGHAVLPVGREASVAGLAGGWDVRRRTSGATSCFWDLGMFETRCHRVLGSGRVRLVTCVPGGASAAGPAPR